MRDKKHPLCNREIVEYFSRRETKSYLTNIYNEVIPSERHNIVSSMFARKKLDFGIYSRIFRLASAQFLEDDHHIDSQLWDILSKMFHKLDTTKIPGIAFVEKDKFAMCQVLDMRHKYIFHVFVPEGIVKCLQEKYKWSWKEANDFFIDADSRITEKELEEFDQEISDEIKKETERKRRELYESNEEDSDECIVKDPSLELPEIYSERNFHDVSSAQVNGPSKIFEPCTKYDAVAMEANPKQRNSKSALKNDSKNISYADTSNNMKANQKNDKNSLNYSIESSVTSKGKNIVIKMKRVTEKTKENFNEKKINLETVDNRNCNTKEIMLPMQYCVCKKEDDGTFMIGCDTCTQWYHPKCLHLSTEQVQRFEGMKWCCPSCKIKKSKSVYKHGYNDENLNKHLRDEKKLRTPQSAGTIKNKNSFKTYHKEESVHKVTKDKKCDKERFHSKEKIEREIKISKFQKSSGSRHHITPKGTSLYCLCRKENDETFMVGCDFCEEWYHPRCLNLSNESAMELAYREWSCPKCKGVERKRKHYSKK